ncbi:ATP-binding protein [Holdemania massiliensis]|uniref:ATP-binding protein n=1 Tax=Holdemania massiliensis TaxID=1468449 RepID=UPI001F0554FC|nr:ATP-binding protein [Holdemania massiliensis]MCH1939634.1 ATP-binding protein [Holdemania massiliensis]
MDIGRLEELEFLERRYKSTSSQLVLLYGRKRLGKTEVLCKFCEGKAHIYYACQEISDRWQLKWFSEKLLNEKISASAYIQQFDDWEKAFRAILELPYHEAKKLVVIDEFPYMCKNNPSIPSILQNLWDEILKDSNVMLILCGSAMSFIEKDLLAEKNPLYGRATGIYKMTEMNFYEASQFFPNYSDEDKVLTYSILGGIPHYLRQFNSNMSLSDNIKQNILSKGCALYTEVDFLLKQELRETAIYNSIIEAVAMGSTRLNEISQKSWVENSAKTGVYLKNLIELGLVEREFSVDAGVQERIKPNRGIYHLTDNYFRFWYAFVYSHYSELETGDVDGVYNYVVAPQLHQFASFTFEDICRQYMQRLQKENKLPFRFSKMGRWTGKTTVRDKSSDAGYRVAETEIDILALSQDKKKTLVGECKFKKTAFNYSEYLDVSAKLTPLKAQSEFYYALFSQSGFDDLLQKQAESDDHLTLYSLDSIVKGIV